MKRQGTPSWVKATESGGLYVDTSDPTWQKLFIQKIDSIRKSKFHKWLTKELKEKGFAKLNDYGKTRG